MPCRLRFTTSAIAFGLLSAFAALHPRAGDAATVRSEALEAAAVAAAHTLGQSYMVLGIHDDSLVVRLEVTTADLERVLGFGWDLESGVTREQVAAQLDGIRRYVEGGFAISSVAGSLQPRFRDFEVFFLEVADYVLLTYVLEPFDRDVEELTISFPLYLAFDGDHRNLVLVEHNWRTGTFQSEAVALIFGPSNPEQTLDLTESSVLRGFLAFIRLGVEHIWAGIDHVLFLVALSLPSVLVRKEGRWQPAENFRRAMINIIKIVTFFTIAHTITLSLATLDVVRLPARPVESVIALSIAAAALVNLLPRIRIREPAIAFAFGLFHGFGFAYVLGDIGLDREYLTLSLLGFNIGVELGQLAIICAIFPILFVLRRRGVYKHILRWGSLGLIAVAMLWFLERALDFNVPLVPIAKQLLGLG